MAVSCQAGVALDLTPKIGEPPPTEFRIFARGENEAIDGPKFTYDAIAARSVLAVYKKHATPLHIDFEHASQEPASSGSIPTEGAPAQGWFEIEDRADGLWAVNVKWLEPAASLITAGKYRLFSPTFWTDEDERIIGLKSLALTNVPRLNGLTPLVQLKEHSMKSAMLHLTKKRHLSRDEIRDAVAEALCERFEDHEKDIEAIPTDVYDDHVVFAMDGKTWEIAYKLDGDTATLIGDPEEVVRNYEKAETPPEHEMDDTKGMTLDEHAKRLEKRSARSEEMLAKGMIDGAIGGVFTPAEAKELKDKLDSGAVSAPYVTGLVTARQPRSTTDAPASRSTLVSSKFGFKDEVMAKASRSPRAENFKNRVETAAAADEVCLEACHELGLDPEKVAKDWTLNVARYERLKKQGRLGEIQNAKGAQLTLYVA